MSIMEEQIHLQAMANLRWENTHTHTHTHKKQNKTSKYHCFLPTDDRSYDQSLCELIPTDLENMEPL